MSVDTILEQVEIDPSAAFVIGHSYGGYTTNLPLGDVLNGRRSSPGSTTANR